MTPPPLRLPLQRTPPPHLSLTHTSGLAPLGSSLALDLATSSKLQLRSSTSSRPLFSSRQHCALLANAAPPRQHLSPVVDILTTTLLSLDSTALLPQALTLVDDVSANRTPSHPRHLNLGRPTLCDTSSYSGCRCFGLQMALAWAVDSAPQDLLLSLPGP